MDIRPGAISDIIFVIRKGLYLISEAAYASNPRAEYYSCPVQVDPLEIKTAVSDSLGSCSHCKLGETVYPPQFLALDTVLRRIKIFNRAGKFSLEKSCIESCYKFGPADPTV